MGKVKQFPQFKNELGQTGELGRNGRQERDFHLLPQLEPLAGSPPLGGDLTGELGETLSSGSGMRGRMLRKAKTDPLAIDSRAVGPSLGAALADLACQVQRLQPSHYNPEAFHIDKSEIVGALRRLAKEN
jgi:hypothetical protein